MKISHIYFFGVIYATLACLAITCIWHTVLLNYLFWWWTLLLPGVIIFVFFPKSFLARFLDKEVHKKSIKK